MLRKLGILVVSFIFSIAFSIFFIVFNLKYFFFQGDFYKEQLDKHQVYEKLLEEIPQIVVKNLNLETIELPIEVTKEDLLTVITGVITPDYLQSQVEIFIDRVFGYFVEGDDSLVVSISLTEPKENIESVILPLLEKKLADFPVCSQEQLLALQSQGENTDSLTCRPEILSIESFEELFFSEESTESFLSQIPETITLISPETEGYQEFISSTQKVREGIQFLLYEVYWGALFVSLLALGLLYLLATPISSKFRIIGVNLINIMISPFLIAISGLIWGSRFIRTMMNSFGNDLTQESIVSLSVVIQDILYEVWILFLKEVCVVWIIAATLIIVSKLYRRREQQEQETVLINQVQQIHGKNSTLQE